MNNTRKRIDIERLLNNANNYTTWLNILPTSLKPCQVSNGYNFGASDGLKLRKGKDGYLFLANHSHKLDILGGRLYKVVCALYGLQAKGNQEDFLKACTIIADASGQILDNLHLDGAYIPQLKIKQKTIIQPDWIPNQAQEPVQHFYYEFLSKSKAMEDYFARWGVELPTLRRYNVRPLHSIQHINSYYATIFDDFNFAFAYYMGADSNIKCKRPNIGKKRPGPYDPLRILEETMSYAPPSKNANKELFIQSSGNYLFGYNQLPSKGKILIIAAGEKDTLVLNQHFNKDGIYAICFTSESTKPPLSFISQLRERFDKVFTCFDNDHKKKSNTGQKAAQSFADRLSVASINIATYTQENDVADIYEVDGLETLQHIIYEETKKSAYVIKKEEQKDIVIAPPKSLDIHIQQYIGESPKTLQKIKEYISKHQKLLLQSRTGTGKNWAIMDIIQDDDFLRSNDCDYAIICVPTTAILRQLEADFNNRFGKQVSTIDGCSTEFDIWEASHSTIILSTYDSLHKISPSIDNAMLFVDEFHELCNAYGYRKIAVQSVFDLMLEARRCIAVSATIPDLFTTNIVNLDFTFCRIIAPQHQEIVVQPILYRGGKERDVFQHCLQRRAKGGTHIIRVNDVKLLETFKHKASQEGQSFDLFSSKKRIYKEDNLNYQSIMATGKLSQVKDWIGTTALFDAGASFRFPVASVNLINLKDEDSFVQHLARPRINSKTGDNETVKVYAYHKEPEDDKVSKPIDFVAMFNTILSKAYSDANFKNFHQQSEIEASYKIQELDYTYWSERHQEWKVDYLAILHSIYQLKQKRHTIDTFYQCIQKKHPHIKVLPPITINLDEDEIAQQHLKAEKEAMMTYKQQAQQLITEHHLYQLMEAVWHSTNNKHLRNKIKKYTLIHHQTPSDYAMMLLDTFPEVFKHQLLDELMARACRLLEIGFVAKNIPTILANYTSRVAFRDFYNRVVTHFELKAEKQGLVALSSTSLLRLQRYHAIIDAVTRWKDKNRKRKQPLQGLTKGLILRLVKEALNMPFMTEREALTALKDLYVVNKKRKTIKGKKLTLYAIQHRIQAKQIFQEFDLSMKEHYQRWKGICTKIVPHQYGHE